MNLNKAIIAGRMTADPQLRQTATGMAVASFGVATNRVWRDKAGAEQKEVEFHNIVVWGRQAEIASKFLTKGALVLVEGRIQTRDWEGKDGAKRKTTEIIAERIQFGPRSSGGFAPSEGGSAPRVEFAPSAQPVASQASAPSELPVIEIGDDIKPEDLPF